MFNNFPCILPQTLLSIYENIFLYLYLHNLATPLIWMLIGCSPIIIGLNDFPVVEDLHHFELWLREKERIWKKI